NVIDFFFRQENEIGNVVLDELVIFIPRQVSDVRVVARNEIVDRDDTMTFRQKSVSQMRPQKTGAPGDDGNGLRLFLGHLAFYLAVGAGICQQEVKGMTKLRKHRLQ